MNKKILMITVILSFIIISVSLVSAIDNKQINKIDRKETIKDSPLFNIRTNTAINNKRTGVKIGEFFVKLLEDRIFLSFPNFNNLLKNEDEIDVLWSSPHGTFCPTMGCTTYCGIKC